jgi:hypothetical protein
MAHRDPRQAIIEYLDRPAGELVWQSPLSTNGWRSSLREPGGEDADPDSVRFIKERAAPGHQLHFVRFATRAGSERALVIEVVQQSAGQWEVRGNAGGGHGDPPRSQPWVNFAAWGWPRFFCGGGRVIGAGSERARRARLGFTNGTMLEDSVEEGTVLFMTDDPVQLPATVEIRDEAGVTLARYQEFHGL